MCAADKGVLDELIDTCRLHKLDKGLTRPLLLLLLYDLLFGAHSIEGGGHYKRLVLQNRTPIQSALARIYIARQASSPLQLLPPALRPRPPHPRYVRINTVLCSQQQAIEALQADGWVETTQPAQQPTRAEPFAFPSQRSFYRDMDIPALLVFPPSTAFHASPLYEQGWLVLQDKASCMSAACLSPTAADVVVDGCAAPGNKTSHLAAIASEKAQQSGGGKKRQGRAEGSVDAFEVDSTRFTLLTRMLSQKGVAVNVSCPTRCHPQLLSAQAASGVSVTAHHANFLSLQPDDALGRRVTAVLLDPTCSGSGMSNTLDAYYKEKNRAAETEDKPTGARGKQAGAMKDSHSEPGKKRKRIESTGGRSHKEGSVAKAVPARTAADVAVDSDEQEQHSSGQAQSLAALSAFQTSLLVHAFTLPAATHIVYSTCSHHAAENEAVVAASLAQSGRRLGWEVEAGLLPGWKRRGRLSDEVVGLSADECERMVRCDAEEDCTNGFFVCGLVRRTGQADMASAEKREERFSPQTEAVSATAPPASSRVAPVAEQPDSAGRSATADRATKAKRKKKKRRRTDVVPQS